WDDEGPQRQPRAQAASARDSWDDEGPQRQPRAQAASARDSWDDEGPQRQPRAQAASARDSWDGDGRLHEASANTMSSRGQQQERSDSHPAGRRADDTREMRLVYFEDDEEKSVSLDAQHPTVMIGRDPSCEIQTSNRSVSRVHAMVTWNHGKIFVQDPPKGHPTNGMKVDGEPLQAGEMLELFADSELLCGNFLIRVEVSESNAVQNAPAGYDADDFDSIEVQAPESYMPSNEKPDSGADDAREKCLVYIENDEEKSVLINAQNPTVLIGRDPACEIQTANRSVSRVHAKLTWKQGKIFVQDPPKGHPTNGIKVDGVPLQPGQVMELSPHSELLCGNFLVRLEFASAELLAVFQRGMEDIGVNQSTRSFEMFSEAELLEAHRNRQLNASEDNRQLNASEDNRRLNASEDSRQFDAYEDNRRPDAYEDNMQFDAYEDNMQFDAQVPENKASICEAPLPEEEDTRDKCLVYTEAGLDRAVMVNEQHPTAMIGRDASCDVHTTERSVSRVHAMVIWKDGKLYVQDPPKGHPTNGIKVNGVSLQAGQMLELPVNSVLSCGNLVIGVEIARAELIAAYELEQKERAEELKRLEAHEEVKQVEAQPPAVSVAKTEAPAEDTCGLCLVYKDADVNKSVLVNAQHPTVMIGRDASCEAHTTERSVSRVHAMVIWNQGRLYVQDPPKGHPTNGIKVNGVSLQAGQVMELPANSVLSCGNLAISVEIARAELIAAYEHEQKEKAASEEIKRVEISAENKRVEVPVEIKRVEVPVEIKRVEVPVENKPIEAPLPTSSTSPIGVKAEDARGLHLVYSDAAGMKSVPVNAQQPSLMIGRDSSCGIHTTDESVSRVHAMVFWKDGKLFIQDPPTGHPMHGTTVEIHLQPGQTLELMADSVIKCGNFAISVRSSGIEANTSSPCEPKDIIAPEEIKRSEAPEEIKRSEAPEEIENRAAQSPEICVANHERQEIVQADMPKKLPAYRLVLNEGEEEKSVTLDADHPKVFVGRDPVSCGLLTSNASVSRVHALVTWNDGKLFVQDPPGKHPTNGTKVDGVSLVNGAVLELSDGSELSCGHCSIRVVREVAAGDASPEPFDLNALSHAAANDQQSLIYGPPEMLEGTQLSVKPMNGTQLSVKPITDSSPDEGLVFVCKLQDGEVRSFHLNSNAQKAVIGSRQDCEFCISGKDVSPCHAILTWDADNAWVVRHPECNSEYELKLENMDVLDSRLQVIPSETLKVGNVYIMVSSPRHADKLLSFDPESGQKLSFEEFCAELRSLHNMRMSPLVTYGPPPMLQNVGQWGSMSGVAPAAGAPAIPGAGRADGRCRRASGAPGAVPRAGANGTIPGARAGASGTIPGAGAPGAGAPSAAPGSAPRAGASGTIPGAAPGLPNKN
ncbi:MAG: FHA domain-containing protein, partial [Proteobacteria bacterium]|nr:FHA domain-containing protein [Pseudomonadota bacterium]